MRSPGFRGISGGSARRLAAAAAGLAVALAVAPGAVVLPAARALAARASETTTAQDPLRTGWDNGETQMGPAAVAGFTQLFARQVAGQVYAQPLVVGSTVVVATEKNWVYGLNAATGAIKWSVSLGPFYPITGCNDLAPDVGVTGGPVYDSATGDVYVMAQIKPGKNPLYSLFGINAGNGKITSSVGVPLHPANDPHLTFSGRNELARPGLLLDNGWVYAAFGSHCDHKPYVGFVAGINVSTGARTLWSDETGVTDNQAGIWQGASGLMSDGAGRIFFTSGNGISPAPGPGTAPPGNLAESVVRLGRSAAGTLSARDFFSPGNAPALDAADTDWGSGGPVGLPLGTAAYPHVLAQAGKDGRIFLLNRDNLGGRHAANNKGALSVTKAFSGEWGHPAVFAGTGRLTAANAGSASDYLYYLGKNDQLRYLKFGVNGSGAPTLTDVGNTSVTFGYSSGSPAVTSNGASPSSAVVWAVYASNATGGGGTLEAFPGVPHGCSAAAPCTVLPIKSWPIGNASKFASVATSGNRVYVGTRAGATASGGTVYGFGAAALAAPFAPAPQASFGQTPVHSTATRNVSLTANRAVTVSGVSASTGAVGSPPPPGSAAPSQFAVGSSHAAMSPARPAAPAARSAAAPASHHATGAATHGATGIAGLLSGAATPKAATPGPAAPTSGGARPVTFPVTLHKGDKLTVPVTFTPAAPGGVTGAVTFATSAGPQQVALAGAGTSPGLYPSQQAVQFALVNDIGQFASNVPAGIAVPRQFDIVNGGTRPVTITAVNAPPAPYAVASAPKPGDVLQPGQSTVVQIVFTPTAPGNYPATFSVSGGDGSTAAVSLTGAGLPPTALFTASPRAVSFGAVPVGKRATAMITLTNTGNEPATVLSASHLTGPFTRMAALVRGLPVNASYNVKVPVVFTPRKAGAFATVYRVTWTDVTGTHTVSIPISGRGI